MQSIRILLACTAMLAAATSVAAESPDYIVVVDQGKFQIRDYAPMLVAQTRVSSDSSAARNTAFRRLFDYISGENRGRQGLETKSPTTAAESAKIAMTSPVTTVDSDEEFLMQFVVPREYDARTVPIPSSALVEVVTLPAERVAVLRYSGRSSIGNFQRAERALRVELEQRGITATGVARQAVYNGPFTPPFLRTNEAIVPIQAP